MRLLPNDGRAYRSPTTKRSTPSSPTVSRGADIAECPREVAGPGRDVFDVVPVGIDDPRQVAVPHRPATFVPNRSRNLSTTSGLSTLAEVGTRPSEHVAHGRGLPDGLALQRLEGGAGDVGGHDDVGQREQRVVVRQDIVVEHIEAGAGQLTPGQRER